MDGLGLEDSKGPRLQSVSNTWVCSSTRETETRRGVGIDRLAGPGGPPWTDRLDPSRILGDPSVDKVSPVSRRAQYPKWNWQYWSGQQVKDLSTAVHVWHSQPNPRISIVYIYTYMYILTHIHFSFAVFLGRPEWIAKSGPPTIRPGMWCSVELDRTLVVTITQGNSGVEKNPCIVTVISIIYHAIYPYHSHNSMISIRALCERPRVRGNT